VKNQRSRVFRSSNWAGGNQNGERKDIRSAELANSKRNQECTEVFGACQLLLVIYQRFCNNS